MELDNIDLGILSMLQDDARTPFTKIAQKLGVSDATIHIRVRKLEDMDFIKKFTIVINDEKIQPITTYVLIRVDPGSVEGVCNELLKIDAIYEISEIHERYDILVKVRGRDLSEVRDMLIQDIRSIPNVVGSEAFTVFKTWKHDIGIDLRRINMDTA